MTKIKLMKKLLFILLISYLAIDSAKACHGLSLVNYNFSVGATGDLTGCKLKCLVQQQV